MRKHRLLILTLSLSSALCSWLAAQPMPQESPRPLASGITAPGTASPPATLEGWEERLTKPAFKEYTLRIQPILMNGCGNSNCHGGAQAAPGLHLVSLPGPMNFTPLQSRQNLAQALRLVNRQHPEQSPLLKKALEPHGGSERAPLGSQDQPAYRTLAQWVRNCTATSAVATTTSAPKVEALPLGGSVSGTAAAGFANDRAEEEASPPPPPDATPEPTTEELRRQLLERRSTSSPPGPPQPYRPPSVPLANTISQESTQAKEGVLGSGAPPMIAGGQVVSRPATTERGPSPKVPGEAMPHTQAALQTVPPVPESSRSERTTPASAPVEPEAIRQVQAQTDTSAETTPTSAGSRTPRTGDPYDPAPFNAWARQRTLSSQKPVK